MRALRGQKKQQYGHRIPTEDGSVETCHSKSAVCRQKVAVVKPRSLKKLWRCDGRQAFSEERLTGLR